MKKIVEIWKFIGKLNMRYSYLFAAILFFISILSSIFDWNLYWELIIGFGIVIGIPVLYVFVNIILKWLKLL